MSDFLRLVSLFFKSFATSANDCNAGSAGLAANASCQFFWACFNSLSTLACNIACCLVEASVDLILFVNELFNAPQLRLISALFCFNSDNCEVYSLTALEESAIFLLLLDT